MPYAEGGGALVRVVVPIEGRPSAAEWRRRAASHCLRSLRRSSSVVPPQTPDLLVGRQGELQAGLLRVAVDAARASPTRSGRSPSPVVPIGKKRSGSVSRQAADERQSASSQAWVRFQINDMANPSTAIAGAGGATAGRSNFTGFRAAIYKGDGSTRSRAWETRPVTLVLAHRGLHSAERENTLAAFAAARAAGADGVELDVRASADGALVVVHDPVAGASSSRARPPAPCRPGCPTLAEALEACAGLVVNVEVKNSPGRPRLRRHGRARPGGRGGGRGRARPGHRLVLRPARRARRRAPPTPGWRSAGCSCPAPTSPRARPRRRPPGSTRCTRTTATSTRPAPPRRPRAGLDVNVWTVNAAADVERDRGPRRRRGDQRRPGGRARRAGTVGPSEGPVEPWPRLGAMHIVVCAKQIPDPAAPPSLGRDERARPLGQARSWTRPTPTASRWPCSWSTRPAAAR